MNFDKFNQDTRELLLKSSFDPLNEFSIICSSSSYCLDQILLTKLIKRAIVKTNFEGIYKRFFLALKYDLVTISTIEILNEDPNHMYYNFVNNQHSLFLLKGKSNSFDKILSNFCNYLNLVSIHFFSNFKQISMVEPSQLDISIEPFKALEKIKIPDSISSQYLVPPADINTITIPDLISYLSRSLIYVDIPKINIVFTKINKRLDWLKTLLENENSKHLISKSSSRISSSSSNRPNNSMLINFVSSLEAIVLMIQNGTLPIPKDLFWTYTLLYAANENRLSHLYLLISHSCSGGMQNNVDKQFWTPLMSASRHGHFDSVNLLIEQGANINLECDSGKTALIKAAENCKPKCISRLITDGAYLDHQDIHGCTALMYSIHSQFKFESTQCILELLNCGADPNLKDLQGQTALMRAASLGLEYIINIFIDYGADIEASDENEMNALMHAISRLTPPKSEEDLLDFSSIGDQSLNAYPYKEYENCSKLLISKTLKINSQDLYGNTALIYATKQGNSTIISELLSTRRDVDLNLTDIFGMNTIHYAIYGRHAHCLAIYIKHYMEIGIERDMLNLALLKASKVGDFSCLELLIAHNADVNYTNDQDNKTPLMYATINGSASCVELLLKHKADVNAKQANNNMTALMYAVQYRRNECIKLLIEYGADKNQI